MILERIMFIDVHCHLDMLENIDKIVEKAKKKGVLIVTDGVNPETNRRTLELSEKYSNVKACLGIYPEDAVGMSEEEIKSEIEFIESNSKKIVGIGEVGMDFSENLKDNTKKQEKIFREFIALSKKLDKPIFVHSRRAENDCIEVLEDLGVKKVVMHYFSGSMKLVDRIVKNGWMLSIPTAVKNSQHFQALIERVPIGQLLCETDSPFSHPDKKFPNEPSNVVVSYEMIAKIKGLNLEDTKRKILSNWKGIANS